MRCPQAHDAIGRPARRTGAGAGDSCALLIAFVSPPENLCFVVTIFVRYAARECQAKPRTSNAKPRGAIQIWVISIAAEYHIATASRATDRAHACKT